ncbi:hypothetical protein, partial [Undibacterium crateris]|uniref:hypothetical protein n=1 Tax=Undibacterium crateris TaxID=2528175 RepID=UPI00192ECBAD
NNPYKFVDPDGRNPVLASRVMYTLAFRAATWAGAGTLGSLIGIGIYEAIHQDPMQSNGPKVPTNIQPNTNPPQSPVIPGDWESRPGSKGGEIFYLPGTDPANGENIRVMPPGHSPVPGLEDGYWVWTGPNGQPFDPKTGKPGGKGSTHVPLPPNSVPPARPQKPTEPPKPPDTTTE